MLVVTPHADPPRIAAHFAILNEGAVYVGFDVDFHPLAAERAGDQKFVRHSTGIVHVFGTFTDGVSIGCITVAWTTGFD